MSDKLIKQIAILWLRSSDNGSEEWATMFWEKGHNEEHHGDCTDVPMSCCRCDCDEATVFAKMVIEIVSEEFIKEETRLRQFLNMIANSPVDNPYTDKVGKLADAALSGKPISSANDIYSYRNR